MMSHFSFSRLSLAVLWCLSISTIGGYSVSGFAQSIEYAFSPHQGATEMICKHIEQAQKTIRVAAFSFTSKPIAKALANARKRGVDVQVVLDKSQRRGLHTLAYYMIQNKVPTRINTEYSIMHNKFMVFDDKTVQLGSFNYTASAEERNAENIVVLKDYPQIATEYTKQWTILWNEAEELISAPASF